MNCRTEQLGGHLYRCKECGTEQSRYNSCRDRHCPKCQGGDTAKWLAARAEELLPVPYFHLVFTIPHELNPVVLHNKALVLSLLFQAVSKTIQQVASRQLGGKVGFFAVLHTWSQRLEFHPHIHVVLPGVTANSADKVTRTRENYFLPRKILAVVFRAVLLKLLRKAFDQKKLIFSGEATLLLAAAKKEWIVYAKKPFAHPQVVLKYLSRYTHRIAISNHRIRSYVNGQVSFSYRDRELKSTRRCTLKASEFLRRFLMHILPKQFVRIRHFGFMANAVRGRYLAMLREVLGAKLLLLPQPDQMRCTNCGAQALVRTFRLSACRRSGSHHRKLKHLPLVA